MTDPRPRLTLLAGGNTVYVYPNAAEDGVAGRIAVQRMRLDIAHPAGETAVGTCPAETWPSAAETLREAGIEIVDTRAAAGAGQ